MDCLYTPMCQSISSYPYPFTFTGKERDEETGFGYFGARYMDHELITMWLSVDPMADKYPGISPYAYCAWNPIKLIDPSGDTVVLSPGAIEMHNRFYKVNDEYTKLYDELHSCKDKLFLIGGYNERPDVHSNTEGGTVVDYYPEEGSKYDDFVGDIYSVQWGDAQPELGGDESHVFLEEMYHAGQILKYKNNEGTIEREYDAKKFAIRVSTSPISYDCVDRRGYNGVPTQLGVISRESKEDACKFLKHGRSGLSLKDPWGRQVNNVVINGAYANFPDK